MTEKMASAMSDGIQRTIGIVENIICTVTKSRGTFDSKKLVSVSNFVQIQPVHL